MNRTVAVVGGGVAGLAVAFELVERSQRLQENIDVVCLEATTRAGGAICSTREEGYLCEWAANGYLDDAPATVTLVRRLGLENRLVRAEPAVAKRYIFREGKLRLLPGAPRAFLGSDVLSWRGKLRVLAEPLMRRRTDRADESVFDFAQRRLGREAAAVLVDALASGIFAGDVRRMSMAAAFPALVQMEAEHGGLLRALIARRKTGPVAVSALTSFRDGMQELTDGLASALGERLRLSTPVVRLTDLGRRGYRLHLREGAPIDAGAVVLASPAWAAAETVAAMDPELAELLAAIVSAPIAVVQLGYFRGELGLQPEGFGFLAPRGAGLRVLGVLWSSSIFQHRAPAQRALYTAMIGGAHDPGAVQLSDRELLAATRRDLRIAMGIDALPRLVKIIRHARGIPQYELNHADRISRIERRLERLPGLWLHGSSYRGVSVNSCVTEAGRLADAALEFFEPRSSGDPEA